MVKNPIRIEARKMKNKIKKKILHILNKIKHPKIKEILTNSSREILSKNNKIIKKQKILLEKKLNKVLEKFQ
jgi:hypothetical protein